MKTPPNASPKARSLALALSWDGARLPLGLLPPAARRFLRMENLRRQPSSAILAKLFAADSIQEIRICWVPRLEGGQNVLAAPFPAPDHLRLKFTQTRSKGFGEILGAVYRRTARP